MATTMDLLVEWVHEHHACDGYSEARDYLYGEIACLVSEGAISDAECVAMVTAVAATEGELLHDVGLRERLMLDLRTGAFLTSVLKATGSPSEPRRVARSLFVRARKSRN